MDIDAFIAALPKAELHVHLVGAASLDTVLELARRHPTTRVPKDRDELARYYEFTDFPHFISVYSAVNKLVTTHDDVQTLLLGLARDLAANKPATEVQPDARSIERLVAFLGRRVPD